ncbi:MAG TPA: DegQ family serine endoprotease [Geminicoccus sp.]|jgi:serine protease Do|uniref:DegQ family serine endoprotease n=1 Tax=Geminicoccus sp. TaxID=2024832 RepID=UPI002E369EAA|nr:DegQ family serine endoprotease [Geminicoccus sp.]HEX2527276.1 DegQ family serine endoprotease [Geminicoccus sp.]
MIVRKLASLRPSKRTALAAALAAVLLGGSLPTGAVLAQQVSPPSFAPLVEKVAPAVVNISTSKQVKAGDQQAMPMPQFPPGSPFEEFFKEFFDQNRRQQQQQPEQQRRAFSLGSGFLVDPAGFVVTNNHVIADSDEIKVILNDDSEYVAKLIGKDSKTDLALLKIERDEPFPFVELGDSDQIKVGDWMLAIGNPFGLGSTVTTGIVSARNRDINAGPYDDFIQVDAAINRGNSGGPSFSLDGKVLGINTAIFSPSGGNVGIGFAIPANIARPIIDSLKTTGRVARGWLGVRIQNVTQEIAESLGLPEGKGALVASTQEGGPAIAAGIQPGDVILEFDHKEIGKMRSLPRIVAETAVNKEVEVLIWRKGQERTVKVTLGELPEDEVPAETTTGQTEPQATPGAVVAVDALGLKVQALTAESRSQFQLGDDVTKGVVVTEVTPNSAAAEEQLQPGDVVVEAAQDPVNTPEDLLNKVRQAQSEGKKNVLLMVERQGDLRFVALRLAS